MTRPVFPCVEVTAGELRRAYGVDRRSVQRWVAAGEIPAPEEGRYPATFTVSGLLLAMSEERFAPLAAYLRDPGAFDPPDGPPPRAPLTGLERAGIMAAVGAAGERMALERLRTGALLRSPSWAWAVVESLGRLPLDILSRAAFPDVVRHVMSQFAGIWIDGGKIPTRAERRCRANEMEIIEDA